MQEKMNHPLTLFRKLLVLSLLVSTTTVVSAQWSTLSLSEARFGFSALNIGSKVYFAGGITFAGVSNKIDILDTKTQQWTTAQLPSAGNGASTQVGSKLLFSRGGTNIIDILDTLTNQWTVYNMSGRRSGMGATSLNGKAYFGGGFDQDYLPQSDVYVYDNATNTWTTKQLSEARGKLVAASVGDKVIFAGGEISNRVDIYNTTTNTWSIATLSQGRSFPEPAVIGNKVFFVGGLKNDAAGMGGSNVIDIYDNSTGLWTTKTLTSARWGHGVAVLGNRLYVAGGDNYLSLYYQSVEIYDASTGLWRPTQQLSTIRTSIKGVSAGGYVFFAGGFNRSSEASATVDISPVFGTIPVELLTFEGKNKDHSIYLDWQTASEIRNDHFDIERSSDAISFNYIGTVKAFGKAANYNFIDQEASNGINYYRLKQVDTDGKFTYSKVIAVKINKNASKSVIYPTYTEGSLFIRNETSEIKQVSVVNALGHLVLQTQALDRLDLSPYPSGIYFIQVSDTKGTTTEKIVKH
jgi:Secretion system C-terminal sorting domain/Kelch motif